VHFILHATLTSHEQQKKCIIKIMNMRETTPLQGRKSIEHDSLHDLKHQCSTAQHFVDQKLKQKSQTNRSIFCSTKTRLQKYISSIDKCI